MTQQDRQTIERGGRRWQLGGHSDVAWIQKGFRIGLTIASAIPPVFEAYATVVDPWGEDSDPLLDRFDRSWGSEADIPDGAWLQPQHADLRNQSNGWQAQQQLVTTLARYGSNEWWLGYLDTGADNVVFPHTSATRLYLGWQYKLVKAGPEQALAWRVVLPDLMFPDDRSWCLSTGWDDDWTCIGGPESLVHALGENPLIEARQVNVHQDATPSGHTAF